MGRGLAIFAALAMTAAAPAAAHGSVAYMDDRGVPTAEGEPGQANDMTAAAGGDGVVFTDAVGIRPRDGDQYCRALSPTEVTCQSDGGGLLLGRDGNDTLRDVGAATPAGFGARGGPGDDTIVGGTAPAIIFGDERAVRPDDGNDTITGSSADGGFTLEQREFDDSLDGGGGNDVINAGPGKDHASGQAGNDVVNGGDGNDVLDSTTLLTEDDSDAPGDAGDDTLNGQAGDDQLLAARGRDKADGGDGDDYLLATDIDLLEDDGNADTLRCGPGADRLTAGASDRVAIGCETLRVSMYCTGGYPCSAKGSVTGRARGARKDTVIAKLARTIKSPELVELKLGSKATKVLGSRKKVFLYVEIVGRRGKKVVSSRFFGFYFTK